MEKEIKEKEITLSEVEEKLSTDDLLDLFSGDDVDPYVGEAYTTELLEGVKELDPSLTKEEMDHLINYLKGTEGRPDFMDRMMTQTNEKLNETIKLMAIMYLFRVPILLDYQKTLQANLLDTSKIPEMTFEDISKVSYNIQKEISELLNFGLNVSKSLSNINTVPTKVERIAQALMHVSDSTMDRIEEILRTDS